MRWIMSLLGSFLVLCLAVGPSPAFDSPAPVRLEVEEFRLENGMLFLVVTRSATPQVACRLAIRAGSALEDTGKTGIAHLLEHMMFKGTKNFGTLAPAKDQALQAQIEAAYQSILKERDKRHPDEGLVREKRAEMEGLRKEVQKIYVPQAFSMQLGRNGAVGVNAFTTKDQTQYLMSVPSDMIEQWFSIVSEQLFEPAWREFYVEKEVVMREWAYRYINNPGGAVWLDLESTAYTAHPYRNPIIGWKSDMERYNTRDAAAFHDRYYHPANAVCVLVGDLTLEKAKTLAETYFSRYPAGGRAPETVTEEPSQQGPRKSVRYLKGARTPLVRIGFHAAPMGTADFYALDAMTMILSHGRGARMTQNVVHKGLALQAWAYNPDSRYGGMVILGGSPIEPEALKNQDLDEASRRRSYLAACEDLERILLSEVDRLKSELVSHRELKRIKKINQRDFLDRMRSNEQLAGTLATLEVQAGWGYLSSYLDHMAAVTAEDIRRVAKKYLRPENQTSAYVIPGGMPDRPPEPYEEIRSLTGSAAARPGRPKDMTNHSIYPTPPGWKHPLSFQRHPGKMVYPEAERAVVASADVFYLPDRTLPLVDLTLLVKAGRVDVDEDQTGLAYLLEDTLVQGGTETYSPKELALILDENAVELSISIGEEASAIHLSVMREDWQTGLALLEDILTRPRFEADVLDVSKQQALTALKRQGENAQGVAAREALIWHFKGHPYGRDPLQAIHALPKLNRDALMGFLKTHFVPSNMVVALSGDMDKAEALPGIERLFQALPRGKKNERTFGEPPETKPVMALIHKPGQVQSQVVLVMAGIRRTHPAYWKMGLLTDILGGNDSLMYKRLRDDLGLVYTAGFYQTYKWKAGLLMGFIGCKGDRTRHAIEETFHIMSALGKHLPEQELEQKRLDALNSFVFNVDTPADLVRTYGSYHLRGEPLDTLEKIQEAFISARAEELRRLAGGRLDPGGIQVFIVTDKSIPVRKASGLRITLEKDLVDLAREGGLPFREIPLR